MAKLEAEQAVDAAEQALRDARAQLAFLLGVRGVARPFTAEGPELTRAAALPGLAAATPEALLERARERRPDLQAARRQRERASA